MSYESTREAQRLAEIEYLGAARPEADHVLQEIVDEVYSIFGTELCMVTLMLSDVQYFRAWSGKLPEDLAQARQDPRERSMCQYVVESEEPLVVKDCQATEAFKNQHFYVKYGFCFYAGVPLTTSSGRLIGDLCLLDTRPRELDEGQMRLLAAYARAAIGRLEVLGALRREEVARENEAKRSRELGWALEKYRQAEEALKESEKRYRTLVELSPDAIAVQKEGKFLYVNEAAVKLHGAASAQQLIGRAVLDFIHPGYREVVLERLRRIREEEEWVELIEEKFIRLDGQPVDVEVAAAPIIYESEQAVQIVCRDITERKELEANQQRFLDNAAHQLRTPIMAILGAAELLATGDDADPALRERLLNQVLSESNRMGRMAETLLSMAQVGRDLREYKPQKVNPVDAAGQAVKLMEPLAQAQGLALHVEEGGGEDGCVFADPEWLQETLLVLLSNAIKHSSQGGRVRLRTTGNTITVEDEGEGISQDDLPHVFERFYRGKGTSSEGFGLGLSICKELIERMGGSISLSSREGIGTTVEVKLAECS